MTRRILVSAAVLGAVTAALALNQQIRERQLLADFKTGASR